MDPTKSSPAPDLPGLEELANYLHDKQDSILEEWQKKIKVNESQQESILASLSQDKFYNSIPEFLEQLRKNLRGEQTPLTHVARKHGAHRWEHGMDLQKVTVEWSLLHLVLVNQVYKAQESISISPVELAEAQKLLTRFVHEGIRASIDEYYRLLRQEAEGKVQVLESMVQEKEELTEQRTQNLQEASHDMKGSMTAFHINLHLLEKADLNDKARVRELIQKLSRASENLNRLFKNLLDLSRLEAGRENIEISEFDAAKLLRSLIDTMQPLADSKNLELRIRGDEILMVRGDRLKVHRIAQNLLSNALKYTEVGYVEVSWGFTPSDQWEFTIRDTGPGMDLTRTSTRTKTIPERAAAGTSSTEMEDQDHTQVQFKSEGLGLYIVRRLCDLLGGVIDIDSKTDIGTTIRVRFSQDYPDS